MYLGVDIASVDGNKPVDWGAAKVAGVCFAIFRGTYSTWADPTWKLEADRARAVGIIVGTYLFPVMDKTAPSAELQVGAFIKAVGPLALGDLPPTLDIEFPGGTAKTGHTRDELLVWIWEAVSALRKAYGIWPMLYTSARVWDGEDADSLNQDASKVDSSELINCPLWLARYPFATRLAPVLGDRAEALPLPPVPKLWRDPTNVWIHQYQGDAIKLPGFTATEDLNRFFGLSQGSKGERVKWIQKRLRITQDGDFGPGTKNAVESYQRVNKLVPDGIVGPKTFAYLCQVKIS
jgi:GH25 family lysozyme M1 (1,4-beta-N-acetylmuramidase)